MMCTPLDGKNRPLTDAEEAEKVSEELCAVLRETVRCGDIVSHYGKNIYLVLLVNISLEDCEIIQRRINQKLREKKIPLRFGYYANNLLPREDEQR